MPLIGGLNVARRLQLLVLKHLLSGLRRFTLFPIQVG